MPVTPSATAYVDVEDLLKVWLADELGYEHIVTELPTNLVFVMPLVVVERFGGTEQIITVDVARVDIDVLTADRESAKAHSETIRQAMRTRLPGYVHDGRTTVLRVDTLSAPTRVPFDSRNTVRRFGASYQLRLHQFGGV